ncbi:MAG: rhomboid family intramembrane serine protease [Fuerstiella sp.]
MNNRKIRLSGSDKARPTDQPSFFAVKLIMGLTVGVFALQLLTLQANGESVVFDWLALEHTRVFHGGQFWRLLTYSLLHSPQNIMHIVCNMLVLFFLGRIVCMKTGQGEFLALYAASAVLAGMMQSCAQAIKAPGIEGWTIGASGAVMCVFVMFTMWYPKVKLYLFGVVGVKAQWLLAGILAYDFLGLIGITPALFSSAGASIGHAAHLGGAVFGFLYIRSEMNLTGWWNNFAGRQMSAIPKKNRPELRVYNPGSQPEVNISGRMDQILEKITAEGEDSLTERERRFLKQASQHLANSR